MVGHMSTFIYRNVSEVNMSAVCDHIKCLRSFSSSAPSFLVTAPRFVSFPVSTSGLCRFSAKALVGYCGKFSHSKTHGDEILENLFTFAHLHGGLCLM